MGTHREALLRACLRTTGPIIEVGAGKWSTPLLLEAARATGRPLVTVEHKAEWRPPGGAGHYIFDSLIEAVQLYERYSVALVDGAADERAIAVTLLLPRCDYIVVHDTELLGDYPGLERALLAARHRHDFAERTPWTTIVSDAQPWTT